MRPDSRVVILAPLLLLAPIVAGVGLVLAGRSWSEVILCTCCTAAAVPVSLPWLLQRPFDLFHPLAFVTLSVVLGTTLRSYYVVFAETERSAWLLDQRPLEEAVTGALVILAATCCIGLGYWVWGRRRAPLERVPALQWEWSMARLRPVFVVVAGLAVLATADFLRRTGFEFNDISDLSTKRRVMVNEDTRDFASLGYHRWAAHALVVPLFYAFLIQWLVRRDRKSFPYALVAGALAVAFPFLTSDRSGVGFLVLMVFMVASFVKRISYSKLAVVAVALVILAGQMREWRMESRRTDGQATDRPIEALLGNRNFTGVVKTGRIYVDTPERMERQHGRTFMLWTIAWIPRTLWKGKPEISMGDRVTREIYREDIGGGYPPGLVGELIINFGLAGVFLGCLAYGSGLRLFYNSFRPVLVTHPTIQWIYLTIVIDITFVLMGLQVARIVMLMLRSLITLSIFLVIIGVPARNARLAEAEVPA